MLITIINIPVYASIHRIIIKSQRGAIYISDFWFYRKYSYRKLTLFPNIRGCWIIVSCRWQVSGDAKRVTAYIKCWGRRLFIEVPLPHTQRPDGYGTTLDCCSSHTNRLVHCILKCHYNTSKSTYTRPPSLYTTADI